MITSHNAKVLKEYRKKSENTAADDENVKNCNCQAGIENFPLNGECLTESVVYKATMTAGDGEVKTYTGLTELPFKKRLAPIEQTKS